MQTKEIKLYFQLNKLITCFANAIAGSLCILSCVAIITQSAILPFLLPAKSIDLGLLLLFYENHKIINYVQI